MMQDGSQRNSEASNNGTDFHNLTQKKYEEYFSDIDRFIALCSDKYPLSMLARLALDRKYCAEISLKEVDKTRKRSASILKFDKKSPTPKNESFLSISRVIEECYIKGSNKLNEIHRYLKAHLEDENLHDEKHRRQMWSILSRARIEMVTTNKDYYGKMLDVFASVPDFYLTAIDNDLKRTISWGNSKCVSEERIEKMRRILVAYGRRNGYLGYCQGMNFIAAKLTAIFEDEEEAYWVFVHLIETVLQMDYFSSMTSALVDQRVLTILIQQIMPDIGKKFVDLGFDLSMVSIQWFVCLFTTFFNEEMSSIAWDFIFSEGDLAIFKISLWILYTQRESILQATDFPDIIFLIENSAKKIQDGDKLREFVAKFYLNKRIMLILRERVRVEIKTKMDQESAGQRTNLIKPPPSMPCNITWPVCHIKLNEYKTKTRKKSFTILRQGAAPLIIDNYFGKKKKTKKPIKKTTALESVSFMGKREYHAGIGKKSFAEGNNNTQKMANALMNSETLLMYRNDHVCIDYLDAGTRSGEEDATETGVIKEEDEENIKEEQQHKGRRSVSQPKIKSSPPNNDIFNEIETVPSMKVHRPSGYVFPRVGSRGRRSTTKHQKSKGISFLKDLKKIKEEEEKGGEVVIEEVPDNMLSYEPTPAIRSSLAYFAQFSSNPEKILEVSRSQSFVFIQAWNAQKGGGTAV